jgi:hypothetical protein
VFTVLFFIDLDVTLVCSWAACRRTTCDCAASWSERRPWDRTWRCSCPHETRPSQASDHSSMYEACATTLRRLSLIPIGWWEIESSEHYLICVIAMVMDEKSCFVFSVLLLESRVRVHWVNDKNKWRKQER